MRPSFIVRHSALLFVALIYGANFAIAKIAVPEFIQPFAVIAVRVWGAAIIFWLLPMKTTVKIDWKNDRLRFIACAALGAGINMLLFFEGLSITSTIHSAIIMTLTPAMVFGFAMLIIKEQPTLKKVTGLFIGLIGALIIVFEAGKNAGEASWQGDVLIFLNAMSYAAYLVLVKPLLAKYPPMIVTRWLFLFAAILITPIVSPAFFNTDWSAFTPAAWMSTAYMLMGITVIAYMINIWVMQYTSPTTIGMYIYVQPIFATIIAVFVLNEPFSPIYALAAALVFGGVGLVVFKKKAQ